MTPLEPGVDVAGRWPARLVAFLHRRALVLIGAVVVAALGLGTFASRIGIDNSLKVWFVEGDPALVAYDHYKATFGNDETIVVAVTAPGDGGIWGPAYLERVRAASKALEALPRVRRVQSLAVSLHATDEDGELVVGTLLPETGAITEADAAAARRRVAADPSFRGVLVGGGDGISLILVEPKDAPDFEKTRKQLVDEVTAVARRELAKDGSAVHFGGIGVVYEGLNDASLKDTTLFVTLSYVILLVGLWVVTRRLVWVAVGGAIVSLAVIATMGLMGLAGRDMNMVTGIVPTLIMTIGVLDLIHLFDAYQEGVHAKLPRERILGTIVAVTVVPCIVNSFTDVIGFASFGAAPVGAIRDLGWLVSAGLMILLVTVLVIAIPALARWGGAKPGKPVAAAEDTAIGKVVLAMLGIATRRRGAVLASAVVLAAGAAFGITRLTVDTYTIGFLPDDHEVRRDHAAIEQQFGPYVPLELTARAVGDATLFEPDVLRAIDRAERGFEGHPRIGAVTGLPEIVKQSMRAYSGDPDAYVVPPSREGVTQLLETVYGQSRDGEDHLNALVDDRAAPKLTHVTARSGLPSANTIAAILDDLQARAAPEAGHVEVRPAGYLPLYVRITQHITEAQVVSALLASGLVTLVMMVLLRSVKLGLLAMVPNLLPASMTLGMMGLVGVPLDLATVLIAGIVIGISVNDTSHIMFRYRHELAQTPADPEGALRRMMLGTGRPVVMSSLVLIAGFSVLLAASVKSVFYFGLLTTSTVLSALVADLVITPALILVTSRRSHDPR